MSDMNIGKACGIFKNIRGSDESNLTKAEAIKRVIEMPTHNGITKEEILDVCDWLRGIAFGDSDRWNRYSEHKPEKDGDCFTIIRRTEWSTVKREDADLHKYPKCGEIWLETDYWSNDQDCFESIGKDNPYWEVLYWMNPGRIEVRLPEDVDGKITCAFGEVVEDAESESQV